MAQPVILLGFALKFAEQVRDGDALGPQQATTHLLSQLMNSIDRLSLLW